MWQDILFFGFEGFWFFQTLWGQNKIEYDFHYHQKEKHSLQPYLSLSFLWQQGKLGFLNFFKIVKHQSREQ